MGACLGVPVQTRRETCLNEFLGIFQLKIIFSENLYSKGKLARKILACRCKNGKFKYALKNQIKFEKGNMR
jgi:hypothetical protein